MPTGKPRHPGKEQFRSEDWERERKRPHVCGPWSLGKLGFSGLGASAGLKPPGFMSVPWWAKSPKAGEDAGVPRGKICRSKTSKETGEKRPRDRGEMDTG